MLRYHAKRNRGQLFVMPPRFIKAVLICTTLLWCGNPARGQIQRLVSPDTTVGNHFGTAVDFDEGRVLVGASGEHSCGENAGVAYIFEPAIDGRYRLAARLAPANCKTGRFFGHVAALSGNIALVGGTRGFLGGSVPNPVYVFERGVDGTWSETAQLLPDNDDDALGFGASIALEGARAVVTSVGDLGVALPGTAFVFERRADGAWVQVERIQRSGAFGASAVLDGERLAVTAPGLGTRPDGGIYIFERDGFGIWQEIGRIGGLSEASLRCDLDGDRLVVGRSRAERKQRGRTEVYERQSDGRWELAETLRPISSYDFGAFGTDVELSGSRLLIVGYAEQINLPYNIDRVVYVFDRSPDGAWRQQHIIDVGNTGFGVSIDLDGQTALIGEASDDERGAAYIVRLF